MSMLGERARSFRVPSSVASVAVALATLGLAGLAVTTISGAEGPRVVPAPTVDEDAGPAKSEVAVLAGGCFWGVQGVYQHVKGVTSAVSGYAGGQRNTARYDVVSQGESGHAESVRVKFDPRKITYGRLLQIFFSVVHDPTLLNRQGPDVGPQYRSAIFPTSAEQAKIAETYIAQLTGAGVFDRAIVTKIETDHPFYEAEAHHQDFLQRNPHYPYIVINDLPKIEDLKRLFPERYQASPVLVGGPE